MKLSHMHASYTWPQGDHPDAGKFPIPYYMSTFPSSVDPDAIVPACSHKHTTSNGANLCSRKRQDAIGVGSDGRNTFPVLVCTGCGQPVYREAGVGLVSIISGDDGGTYDVCETFGKHTIETWPEGPMSPTLGGDCILVREGMDTDGETMFYRCTVHDKIVIGFDMYCEDG